MLFRQCLLLAPHLFLLRDALHLQSSINNSCRLFDARIRKIQTSHLWVDIVAESATPKPSQSDPTHARFLNWKCSIIIAPRHLCCQFRRAVPFVSMYIDLASSQSWSLGYPETSRHTETDENRLTVIKTSLLHQQPRSDKFYGVVGGMYCLSMWRAMVIFSKRIALIACFKQSCNWLLILGVLFTSPAAPI